MLFEFYKYLTSSASKEAKQYGYLYSSIALEARVRRVNKSWQSHNESCKKWILLNIPQSPKTITVFGSGLLLEFPILELLEMGHQIVLVDMVHPKSVRSEFSGNRNIKFIELDITGFVGSDGLNFQPPVIDWKSDFWISANIWSQLALEPIKFQKKALKCQYDDERIKSLVNKITTDHWDWMCHLEGCKLLYSDVERIYRDPSGLVLDKAPSYVKRPDRPYDATWIWKICPLGEESKKFSFEMRIEAYKF